MGLNWLDLALPIPLLGLLLSLSCWVGLGLVGRRLPTTSLARALLLRSRSSLAATLLLACLLWWIFELLARGGWDGPRSARELRDAVLVLGLLWTTWRGKAVLLRHAAADPRWLGSRPERERTLLLDLIDKLVSALVLLLGGLELLRLLGIPPALLLTASGVGAAALGFGARTLVENLLAGVMLYINRPFSVGERIELPERKLGGTVRAIGIYYSELLTLEGQTLYLPNSLFASSAIGNASRSEQRHLQLDVALRGEDHDRAAKIIEDVGAKLEQLPGLLVSQPHRVHLVGLSEGRLQLRIEAYLDPDPERFHAGRQQLLLEVAEAVTRHGAALAGPIPGVRPAPDGQDRP